MRTCASRRMIALFGGVALSVFVLPAPRAWADDPAIILRGNPMVRADRAQLLRDEFRERQNEIRESEERLRNRRGHGRKAVPAPVDPDRIPASLRTGRGSLPSGISGVAMAPLNVKANDKTSDAAGAGQAEQSLAFLGQLGVCAWNDGQGFNLNPQDVQGYGWTNDGGVTWTDGGIPLKSGTITTWSSDPSVTVNEKTGNFYYTGLTNNSGTNNNGVAVARGHFTAGVFNWDAATVVASGPSGTQIFDKEWMCADSSNGNLYVTWTLFTAAGSNIFFSRSVDNGANWSAPLQVSRSWENGLVSGSRPVVGPNGEVYVVYSAIGAVDADSLKITKSTNGGVSFGASFVAMTKYDNYFDGAPGFNRARAVTFPSVAVDRTGGQNRGRVYMTIQDCVNFYSDPIGGGTSKSEVENNGNFANATPFTINQNLRGNISSTTDTDWWKFPATQGTTYIFFIDSLRTTLFRYQMRIYCPNDTTTIARLASSGNSSTTDNVNQHALIVWTAPTTATYYLRILEVSSTGGYRIRTGVHTPGGTDIARDTRDVTVASSADGQTGWTARVRVNDDAALYDNWLPEIAVPSDGYPYTMWFDWRDTPASCFGGSNIYVSRSTDGGATWAPNQIATTASTPNWTQVASNISPNQGDYNGMYGGDALALAWADGRLGDADIFAERAAVGFTLGACPGDQTVNAGATFSNSVSVNNLNSFYTDSYNYTVTVDRDWPGFPINSSTSSAPLSSGSAGFSFTVPDTAASEVVHVCLAASLAGGTSPETCCFDLTVNSTTAVGTPTTGVFALRGAQPNPGSGRMTLSFSLVDASPATIALYDLSGRRVGFREVGGKPGFQEVALNHVAPDLPSGVYLLRLSQHGRTLLSRFSIVR